MKKTTKNIIETFADMVIFGFLGIIIGSIALVVGYETSRLLFCGDSEHMCTCDLCKTRRQLESCEVIDSIINERIVIVMNSDENSKHQNKDLK